MAKPAPKPSGSKIEKRLRGLARRMDMRTAYTPPFHVLSALQAASSDGSLARKMVATLEGLLDSDVESVRLAAVRELSSLMGVLPLVNLGLKQAAGGQDEEDEDVSARHKQIAERFGGDVEEGDDPSAPAGKRKGRR